MLPQVCTPTARGLLQVCTPSARGLLKVCTPSAKAKKLEFSTDDEDDKDCLEWTMSPVSRKLIEGSARFWVSLPRVQSGCPVGRLHSMHIDREVEIEPMKSKKEAPLTGAKSALSLHIRECDLRQFGGDLTSLKRCDLGRREKSPPLPVAATTQREMLRLMRSTLTFAEKGSCIASTASTASTASRSTSSSSSRSRISSRPVTSLGSSSLPVTFMGGHRPIPHGGSNLPQLRGLPPASAGLRKSASSPEIIALAA
ncbi:unnamed protein product [Polarella glacialis]|uniref:Uncharacterized protein n=1 Tax=Polarella glacialis TaxID=89957 RepID=A0A813DAC7_POLGL|nr:unnamed protein product [Polarella glacialis]CAE8582572.1 unnamed protein product [Polarella glacialis]CAE8582801.1 unnamed protein product [Polarella glacialis]CAE8709146.1 unnamed protein product [Polarella glacialis]